MPSDCEPTPPEQEPEIVADPEVEEELSPVSCPACGTANEVPAESPPIGHRLVCSACGAALVETVADANGAAPDVLWRLFRHVDRATINPVCPHCDQRNYALCVRANDRWGWNVHADAAAVDDEDRTLTATCCHCNGEFYVEWDSDALI